MSAPKYRMTISLHVLDHLGLNLYSSMPAVLSEAVANAWDADAEKVEVTVDRTKQEITLAQRPCNGSNGAAESGNWSGRSAAWKPAAARLPEGRSVTSHK
jgi:hypothetical protein